MTFRYIPEIVRFQKQMKHFYAVQVVRLRFVHFDLGQQSADLCNVRDDRLVVSEKGQRSYCVSPNIKNIVSKTNELNVTFVTNSVNDAQGFRAFYTTGLLTKV